MKKAQSKIILLSLIAFIFFIHTFSLKGQNSRQENKVIPICVAYYNVENLFDTIHQSGSADADFTPQGSYGWNTERYLEKLDRLAEVISLLGQELTPDGPVIIGLSEIENEGVVWDLAHQERIRERNYQVVFIKGRDRRVHNAFMYNPKYFEPTHITSTPVIMEDNPDFRTRNHLVMSGLLLGEPMHFIVSHWPSRSGGEARSRPRRIAAAQAARSTIDSIKSLDPDAKIVFMGDLNDDPTDISVTRYLNTSGDRKRLKEGQLYNPFVDYARRGIGTLAWRDSWNLFDQIIVTQSLLDTTGGSIRYHRAEVFNKPFLRQQEGRFRGYPFRSFGGGVYLGGYSDHFPTYIFLLKEIN
jgi:hypothetical protein